MPGANWEPMNVKIEDAVIIDRISKDTGLKKYAIIRNMLKACYPEYCLPTCAVNKLDI
jgi:hypothetical protein